jgi:LuxR family transcriptional regulator, maltose regulon positive regulatory protein
MPTLMTITERWLLNTVKLAPPGVTANLIPRPRLTEQLDRGVLGALTLVSASVGYGKTTLISAWLQSRVARHAAGDAVWPAAWLSLDEYDSDLTVFLRYFCAALDTIFPQACTQTLAMLQAPSPPPLDVLVATLSNEIQTLPQDFIVVLDDYHTVNGMVVSELLSGLARHWPRHVHMVIATRRSPPLLLARLRATGQLAEIRTRDLRFTLDETTQYLTAMLGAQPSEAAVMQLERQFEGWIAGLHLASLAWHQDVGAAGPSKMVESDGNVGEYLIAELLSQQPPDVMAFLLHTALLNRFCAPLCEEVIRRDGTDRAARACLEWLERTNFPIVALDDRREWYRYHHLLRDLLRARAVTTFGATQVLELHRRAANWFAQQGMFEEALQHALAAPDLDQAAELMEQSLCGVLNRGDLAMLRYWLHLLPEDFRRQRPGLLLIEAWVLHFTFQIDLLPGLLERIELLLVEHAEALGTDRLQSLRRQVLTLRGEEAHYANQVEHSIACMQEALALLPQSWSFVRGVCAYHLGLGWQSSGQGAAAHQHLWALYEAAPDKNAAYALRVLGALCFSGLQAGLLEKAREAGALLQQQAQRGESVLMECWAHYYLGLVHYEWNELEAAAQHFQAVALQRYSLHSSLAREGLLGIARVQVARGDLAAAQQALALLSLYDVDIIGHETQHTLAAHAQLHYLQGDTTGAWRWADAFDVTSPDQPLLMPQDPRIIKTWLLIARQEAGDAKVALDITGKLALTAARTHNIRFKIVLLALQALALDVQGQGSAAQAAIQEALDLAHPGGFIRTFVDLGAPMQVLLDRLVTQRSAPQYVYRVLAAFTPAQSTTQPRSSASASAGVQPLTVRELDILTLMRSRLSAKEIARELGISPMTVNRHAANLYTKLGVNTRWEAVAKAEELGILSSR